MSDPFGFAVAVGILVGPPLFIYWLCTLKPSREEFLQKVLQDRLGYAREVMSRPYEPPPQPDECQEALNAGAEYERRCAIIDAMPLDDREKENAKRHARRNMLAKLKRIVGES